MPAIKTRPKNKPWQSKQRLAARPANLPLVDDRYKLSLMKRDVQSILRTKPRRYLEAKTGRSGAWWQLVARGKFGPQCRPNIADFYVIRAIAGVVGDESQLDAELLTKLVRVMECVGALVAAIADLISSVRRKAKTV